MGLAKGFQKISNRVDQMCLVLIVLMLGTMVGITCAQIICRGFFKAIIWSEEVTRYLLIWSTFIGTSCVYKAGGHISITALHSMLPPRGRKAMQLVVHVLCIIVFVLAVYFGIKYAGRQINQLSAVLRLPMTYAYAAIPVGFGLSLLHAVNEVIQILFGQEEA